MDIFLMVLAFFCLFLGLIGAIVPILPGPPISYLGLWLLKWSGFGEFSATFMWVWAAITLIVTVADYILPGWMTKRLGGSKRATRGATIGMIVGMFILPPFGLIVGTFLGAFLGELLNESDNDKALQVAAGSFMAFLCGTGIKLVAGAVMLLYGILSIFV